MRIPRISHEIVITQYEDGSHDIRYDGYEENSFVGFASYLMSGGFAEHWIDKLPDYLVHKLHEFKHEDSCEHSCNHDEPVIQPTEVFSESSDEDDE